MRFALADFSHETNTYAPWLATYERFAQSGILRGEEIIRRYRHSHSSLSGFLDAADHFGFELVPLIYASTLPCGMITRDAFERIVGEMLDLIERQGPWDAVLLANHGAAVAEDFPDVDGEIAARVRALVGPNVPIGMALDLHGNISRRMIENSTACVFYRQNPHLDPTPRAFECAEIIYRTVRGEVKPVQALETPPLVVNIVKQFTGEEPMASLMRACDEVIAESGHAVRQRDRRLSLRGHRGYGDELPCRRRRRSRGGSRGRAKPGRVSPGKSARSSRATCLRRPRRSPTRCARRKARSC